MKKLTQAVFDGAPDWFMSAAIHGNGYARLWSVPKSNLAPCGREFISTSIFGETVYSMPLGDEFDATDWQNSAIDKEVVK